VASPNLRDEIVEIKTSLRILQQCLDNKKTRNVPTDLNEELFRFSQFHREKSAVSQDPSHTAP